MGGICLPLFNKHCIIEDHEFQVFDNECRYDVILGGDFLKKVGMNLLYDRLEIKWLGNVIPMETMGKPD